MKFISFSWPPTERLAQGYIPLCRSLQVRGADGSGWDLSLGKGANKAKGFLAGAQGLPLHRYFSFEGHGVERILRFACKWGGCGLYAHINWTGDFQGAEDMPGPDPIVLSEKLDQAPHGNNQQACS